MIKLGTAEEYVTPSSGRYELKAGERFLLQSAGGGGYLLETMENGSIIAISSTAKPDTVKALHEIARKKGIDVLDAPICRGRCAADEGTLLALVGAKPEVVERARPIYGTFASDIVHLGEVGHGQVAKTMNNLLLWVNAVALIEAGKLAPSTGIDLPKLRGADHVVGQVGRTQRMGHDHLHLGAQGHADRFAHDRQSRPVAADHRRDQGMGQRSPPHQGEKRPRFFAAFNDNFLKNALVLLILAQIGGERGASLVTLAGAIFIAPFFLLSGIGGEIADKFDKAVRRAPPQASSRSASPELAAAGFCCRCRARYCSRRSCLFGVTGALFGPVKYGILPDHLTREELPAGNALVEGATFLAILSVRSAGGFAMPRRRDLSRSA